MVSAARATPQTTKETNAMLEQLKKLMKDEEAPTAVEYGLMLAGIAVAVMVVVFTLGDNVDAQFESVNTKILTRKP
jgi:pilus assembly protein Flp/PilA